VTSADGNNYVKEAWNIKKLLAYPTIIYYNKSNYVNLELGRGSYNEKDKL
jgi:hypothetical protein